MTNKLDDIRCGHCARKLAEGRYIELSIKCPRCGTINHLRAASPSPARPRASESKDAHAWPTNHNTTHGR
ncbi:Com family DNA-binding transcriptional regulator [Pseudogulbenkiania sp. NH8B]|uniref:Com family DNA-binding transcriptional regulator n=1 Tax=Pseudogulbenkiania sp. (strain NH8B) TaxID=748280 RepID=UPI000A05604E|nr:Com family DNA-binding transcriptional regulator [Pseudogulbenkiania sp. NH8B]